MQWNAVELLDAKGADLVRIENMMQFYNYDLSEWVPVSFNDSGLFSIKPKDAYWAKPSTKPFLIVVNQEVAGFVVVDDEGPHPDTSSNIRYFFVARRFRGQGVGMIAVKKLLERLQGSWQIYYINHNATGGAFWKKVVASVAPKKLTTHSEHIDGYDCTLYKFSI